MSSNGNGYRIREVNVSDIPPQKGGQRSSRYWDLYREIMLRLEQTPATCALEIPFVDQKSAIKAQGALHHLAIDRVGKGVLRFKVRPNGNGAYLYVMRGPEWKK